MKNCRIRVICLTSALFILTLPAVHAAIDPCELPTSCSYEFGGLRFPKLKNLPQLKALEALPGVVSDSPRTLARCVSVQDPDILACVSIAESGKRERMLIFDAYQVEGEKVVPLRSFLQLERKNNTFSTYSFSGNGLTINTLNTHVYGPDRSRGESKKLIFDRFMNFLVVEDKFLALDASGARSEWQGSTMYFDCDEN